MLAVLSLSLLVRCAGAVRPPASPEGNPAGPQARAPESGGPARKPSLPRRVFDVVVDEAQRYVSDGVALVSAPRHWDGTDWRRAAEAGGTLGVLFAADESIDSFARRQRSAFTDRVSGATTWIGGAGGLRIGFVLLGGGLVFSDANTRDMGREVLEACLFSSLETRALKNLVGRRRPFETNGETAFDPFSSRDSFPSGHATQAFAIASVIAMRSPGWVVPALAYTAATIVAFDRINDRVHFASDVFAGAVVGTVTGRFLVARHRRRDAARPPPSVEIEILPIRSGVATRLRF